MVKIREMRRCLRSRTVIAGLICLLAKEGKAQETHQAKINGEQEVKALNKGFLSGTQESDIPTDLSGMITKTAFQDRFLIAPPVALKPRLRPFSAGIALQHPLPISGQKPIAYGYRGSSLLADYIPSIWLRLERPKRWFLQGEFIYSAPQLVKEFDYSRQTKPDTGFSSIATVLTMKKTFFHQIPLSFNYYLKSTWSLGAGVGYAWLQGAITQREVIKNTWQGQIVEESNIVPINQFTDSFLHRSHSFLLLQTEYKWKRLSAGFKYTRDLQSFITYTAPDGRLIDKKNAALSVVLRFRLWEQ
jgi:hypothetical protein